MEKNKKGKTARINILLLLLIVGLVCFVFKDNISGVITDITGEKMIGDSKYNKVLVIGIDGMDPQITRQLLAEGKLPNFKKLAETGTFTELKTSNPPHSPVAWTSIATGTNPGKHNIFDFIRRDPQTYMPELSLAKSASGIGGTNYESYVKSDPFWRITSKLKIPTTIIRWPVSFPPERVEGNLLSGLGVPDIKGFLSGYTLYTSQDIKSDKPANKIIKVTENNGLIETELPGPRTRKSGELVEIKIPLQIKLLADSAEIIIDGESYQIKENSWSDWVRVKFKVGLFKNVHGIFKAHLVSLNPFEMYLTTLQIDPEKPIVDISYPNKYSKELAEEIGLYYTLGMPEETDGLIEGRLSEKAFLEQISQIENERDKMFWSEFKQFKNKEKGVFALVYDSSDRLQHVFWDEKILNKDKKENGRKKEEKIDIEDEKISVSKAIIAYYIVKDRFLGKVLEQLDVNTLLLIISDHGFTSFERSASMNNWLVENDFMTITKDLNDFDEIDDGVLFRYVDWSQTKAYSLGFNSLYINVKGREGKGIVEEGEEREKVITEIATKLESFIDPKTGRKVVNKAYRREEVYQGDLVGDAPDIIIGYNPGYRMAWQTAIGGFTKEVLIDNTKRWDGDHLVDPKFVPGVLFSNAKLNRGAEKNKNSASQMDIAPTVLDALGIESPEEIDGRSLLR